MVKCEFGYDIGLVSLSGELVKLQLKKKQVKESEVGNILKIPTQIDLDRWHRVIEGEKKLILDIMKFKKNV